MGEAKQRFVFEPVAAAPVDAVVIVFDLEGFSRFFSQPDVHAYVPRFLNMVFEAIRVVFEGGTPIWKERTSTIEPLMTPTYQKFLGDGALYLLPVGGKRGLTAGDTLALINRLWNLKSDFHTIADATSAAVPVVDVPRRIRFGVARGSGYKLTYRGSRQTEYVGYCINLAARLQGYCPELGFIASARLRLPDSALQKANYVKVVAKRLKNFPKEIVIVDRAEYDGLEASVRAALFDPLPKSGA